MKTAEEMRRITIGKNSIVERIENYVSPLLEDTANNGEFVCRIEVDQLCQTFTRPYIVSVAAEYLRGFGYTVESCYNSKYIDISW